MIKWQHVVLGWSAVVCGAEVIWLHGDLHTGAICIVVGLAILAYGVPPGKEEKET